VADVRACLDYIRERAPLVVHVNLATFGRALSDDTCYRNQFETSTSGGTRDLAAR
jgi:hypothetical protein